jgi:serine/threonine-protein kinase
LALAAALFGIGFFLSWLAAPPEFQPKGTFPILDVSAVVSIAVSMLIFHLSRRWRSVPVLLLRVALAYELFCCFVVAISEQWLPWSDDAMVRGISWVCLILVAFPLTVPSTPNRVALSSLMGATMGPIALFIAVLKGNRLPAFSIQLELFLPTYLAAALAYVLSRAMHRLGSGARERGKLGVYVLEERLGTGGMGEVWRARHRLLARPAAVKLVRGSFIKRSGLEDARSVLRRFEHEAQATASLTSPHTIQVYDFGVTEDGTFYYVMEMLDGLDLESMVAQFGRFGASRAVHILLQACESLQEAHERGMIHRDVKPANIYVCKVGLERDFVKILDFGLVISTPEASNPLTRLTAEGFASGTPEFMAPEAVSGAVIDPRADIYALGCVAYWMLTGKAVFESSSPVKLLADHLSSTPVPPSARIREPIVEGLERIVLSCLAKHPADRPPTAIALADQLRALPIKPWTREDAERWWLDHSRDQTKATSQATQ